LASILIDETLNQEIKMNEKILPLMKEFENEKNYWLDKLSGEIGAVKFYTDFPKTPGIKKISRCKTFYFGEDLNKQICRICNDNDLSIYVFLLAAFKVLVLKYSGQEDTIIASPMHAKDEKNYNDFILLRDFIHENMTFMDVLMAVKDTVSDAYKNQHYPMQQIFNTIGNGDIHSFLNVVITHTCVHKNEIADFISNSPLNDITLSISKNGNGLEYDISYNSTLFKKETIQGINENYMRTLQWILANIKTQLNKMEMVTPEEKQKLLQHFNNTAYNYTGKMTLHELFEERVSRAPNHTALRSAVDLQDIHQDLESENTGSHLMNKYEKYCFKKNPYIFETGLDLAEAKGSLRILKTHHHNSVIVNNNLVQLLNQLDGRSNLGRIFSQLKHLHIPLLISPVSTEDILEISYRLKDTTRLALNGKFETLVSVIKLLYNNHLIRLTGFSSVIVGVEEESAVGPPSFDTDESLDYALEPEKIFILDKELSKARVLLLGDTPGIVSTGLLYLASYLRRNGIPVFCRFYDPDRDMQSLKKNIEHLLERIQPEVVAVSMKWFLHIARVRKICAIVKHHSPTVKVVLGGNTAAYYPEEFIKWEHVDYLVRGDGEVPLLEICQGKDFIQNCIYKRDGKILRNPITYIENETNGSQIYLSHLQEIMLSSYAPLFGSFFIYTHKGCQMNCFYCGGCNRAHQRKFNRKKLFRRGVKEVRKDIKAARPYTSTFVFDFDTPDKHLLEYCRQIWQGIDLSSHFCILGNLTPPSARLIEYAHKTFKYVYWTLDIASLSQSHRQQLASLGLVKPQPTNEQIRVFFDQCQGYGNGEIRINMIAGLPYFSPKDIQESETVINELLHDYSCASEFHWARLHAQPGAPLLENAETYDMHSYAVTYHDFLNYSETNLYNNPQYPTLENYNYPYIYFNQEELNSAISKHYHQVNQKLEQHKENKRKTIHLYEELTYQQLNKKTNRLAAILRKKGVTANTLVGIMVDSSLEMTIAILAVLKAGGAYLPIDPNYPETRILNMLQDPGISILLTKTGMTEKPIKRYNSYFPGQQLFFLDEMETILAGESGENLKPIAQPTDLAYTVFTSGTMGKPKGVLVPHQGVANYTLWRLNSYQYTEKDVTLQLLSYGFDGFVSNFYSSLLSGGALIMIPDARKLDMEYIEAVIKDNGVTNFSLVPGIYEPLLNTADSGSLKSLRFVVLGGERARPQLISLSREKIPGALIINEYGPTEASVTACANIGMGSTDTATIGTPIANAHMYILDRWDRLVPIGVLGQLGIAGTGVARGYLNNPELTAEKFRLRRPGGRFLKKLPPWTPRKNFLLEGADKDYMQSCNHASMRLSPTHYPITPLLHHPIYLTGDLARWLPDGNIELLGRSDQQVKIRGFRIELEEIESQLLTHDEIKEALVIDRQDANNSRYLCAYIVKYESLDETSGIKDLKKYLSHLLPDYMIPAYFVQLDQLPLTTHGKIDRKALPEPQMMAGQNYAAPNSDIERKLVEVWSGVLGIEKIGINDDFFDRGGDSIKTIQVQARMNKFGYKLEMNDIFKNPTIAQLAKKVKKHENIITQSIVNGDSPLTPIQKELFEKDPDIHHFNQAVMLYSKKRLDEGTIRKIFTAIQTHHDALRMTYKRIDDKIIQTIHGPDYPLSLQVHDLRGASAPRQKLLEKANQLQGSIDLEKGPLMKLALFHLEDGDRLLIVIHHLVTDGVSWRILFEDIEHLYRQYAKGDSGSLPLKTDSFKHWSEKLNQYAKTKQFLQEMQYWKKIEQSPVKPIKKDFEAEHYAKDSERASFTLSKEKTEELLTKVNTAYHTEINDILLTGLGLAVQKTFANQEVLITLEGHGRETIIAGADISRTVGWFTATYPVLLDMRWTDDLSRQIKEVKECLHRVPNKGIGYGILKHLTPTAYREGLTFERQPQVEFNYLGQFDADVKQMSVFEVAAGSVGNTVSPNRKLNHDFSIGGIIANNRLSIKIIYSKKQYKPGTVEKLIDHYEKELIKVIDHCVNREKRQLTPGDFTYPHLSIPQIDALTREYEIEDIYPLSPMQEGMLFHSLQDPSSLSYLLQASYCLKGELDPVLVEKTVSQLFKRHDVLRTIFVDIYNEPLQIVLRERNPEFTYVEIHEKSNDEKRQWLADYKKRDRSKNFSLKNDVLMRVGLIRTEEKEFEIIWTFHHILMDGWCIGILTAEFFEIYSSYLENRDNHLAPVTPYRTYIQWVTRRDQETSKIYWKNYLDSFNEPTGISKMKEQEKSNRDYKKENLVFFIDQQQTGILHHMAVKNQVTMNTIIQTVWGIILQKYNNKPHMDVVFGTVVSGRSSEIEGIETMVGIFVNTVPTRIHCQADTPFIDLIKRVQEEAIKSEPHHYYPLVSIQAETPLKQYLFDHIFAFENYPLAEEIKRLVGEKEKSHHQLKLNVSKVEGFEQSHYDLNVRAIQGKRLKIDFLYNANVYEKAILEKVANHFKEVVQQVSKNEKLCLNDIKMHYDLLDARVTISEDDYDNFSF
jgi:amino acid adenylation domain-containing protein/non-ribosomal peptide synthase protein (TIGR01720 family)